MLIVFCGRMLCAYARPSDVDTVMRDAINQGYLVDRCTYLVDRCAGGPAACLLETCLLRCLCEKMTQILFFFFFVLL